MARSSKLLELTWPEVDEVIAAGTPIVLPIGSVEQHGPHLPLGTDSYLVSDMALRLATTRPLVVAPAISYACYSRPKSGGGRTFPGSLGTPLSALKATLVGVVSELIRQGFRSIAVFNGHYENSPAITEALEEAVDAQNDARALLVNWWELLEDADLTPIFPGGFPGWEREHASIIETSLMQVLRPELVREDLKAEGGAARIPHYDIFPSPPEIIAPNGILFTAAPASPEIGKEVLDIILERLGQALDTEFAGADGGPTPSKGS